MSDIHVVRTHGLGLPQARKLAFRWVELAERRLDMECTYEEGEAADVVRFRRAGARGELKVTAERFELDARLGLLLGVFSHRIEGEIVRNLDELLAHEDPLEATEQRVARHDARHAARRMAARTAPAGRR